MSKQHKTQSYVILKTTGNIAAGKVAC